MNEHARVAAGQRRPAAHAMDERLLRWSGRLFRMVALAGMGIGNVVVPPLVSP